MSMYYEYTPDIVRINIDNYNDKNYSSLLNFKANSTRTILESTNDYHLTVEKLEIPINGKNMYINADNEPYTICIYNDNKPEHLIIPELAFGPNYFEFGGPVKSVQEFLDKLNDFTFKKPLPLTLGQFLVEDKKIVFVYDKEDSLSFSTLELYIDERLSRLLEFNMATNTTITYNGKKLTKVNIVTDYTLTPPGPVKVNQNKSTFHLFFTLKAIRVYTNLPIDNYYIYNMNDRFVTPSNLLCETIFDTLSMYDITNYIYIPQAFRHTSLQESNSISSFELSFKYKYANGEEMDIYLDPNDYASITLAFFKKSQ